MHIYYTTYILLVFKMLNICAGGDSDKLWAVTQPPCPQSCQESCSVSIIELSLLIFLPTTLFVIIVNLNVL